MMLNRIEIGRYNPEINTGQSGAFVKMGKI